MIREFEGELSGVLMERICRQWAEWWQMTSSSFISPLDCLTSFLGISLSRAVSSFGRITNVPKLAITAESYIRSWRKPPEMPEVCRMAHTSQRTPKSKQKGWSSRIVWASFCGSLLKLSAACPVYPRPTYPKFKTGICILYPLSSCSFLSCLWQAVCQAFAIVLPSL